MFNEDDLLGSLQEGNPQMPGMEQYAPEGMENPENMEDAIYDEVEEHFNDNLALNLDDAVLSRLANSLLEDIELDRQSRSRWEKAVTIAYKYLGLDIEEFSERPFMRASAATDGTMLSALLKAYAMVRAELLPADGPVKTEIFGVETPELSDAAERVAMFMNYYLTTVDEDYYKDTEKLIFYVLFFGCAFRKVYQDPILGRPVARTITPQNFIVDHDATSLASAARITQQYFLSKREVLINIELGEWKEFELPSKEEERDDSVLTKAIKKTDGITNSNAEESNQLTFYECFVELSDSDFDVSAGMSNNNEISKPYIVTICKTSKKIVDIRRNWKEEDASFKKKDYIVSYQYLSGFGMYGIGLAQLMGSSAIALTSLLRQQIDAGALKNFPGGLKDKNMRLEDNDKAIGPCEFRDVETAGNRIQDMLMLMPYNEPSQVLSALRQELKGEASEIPSINDAQIPENANQMPVGTTLALLEYSNKVQSTVLRSLHDSFKKEFKLLFNLFAQYLEDVPYPFNVSGKEQVIMKQDFNSQIQIQPVSDPNISTSAHRIIKAESILKMMMSNPDIHNIKEGYVEMYKAMGIQDIDKLFKPEPQPMAVDPVSENMLLLLGKPIKTDLQQDDEAHEVVHRQFLQNPFVAQTPQMFAQLNLHIQQHEINKQFKMMQSQMQIQSEQIQHQYQMALSQGYMGPAPQIPEVPQIQPGQEEQLMQDFMLQNQVADLDAHRTMQEMQAKTEMEKNQITPEKIGMADIEERRRANELKAETEAFKSELKFETDKRKIEQDKEIADDKNAIEMIKSEKQHE